ncbi:hypothetical protein [Thiohalocapsa halophila]|uniref:hypothetical protein n=1 Tax=Thiohalocapsa halophila TaxID=69359 RepID=UPI0019079D7D|nr:hypothetical protein [Thiohalocapsa halophila]
MANYALRVPESLFAYARKVADEKNVSMNQLFVTAIAEKVAALKTETYFRERRARGDLADLDAWLDASPDSPPERWGRPLGRTGGSDRLPCRILASATADTGALRRRCLRQRAVRLPCSHGTRRAPCKGLVSRLAPGGTSRSRECKGWTPACGVRKLWAAYGRRPPPGWLMEGSLVVIAWPFDTGKTACRRLV